MTPTGSQPGVAAGTLDSTLQSLRDALSAYRAELQNSEAAFTRWESQWHAREQQIDAHLKRIHSRLGTPSAAPALSLVCSDEESRG
jgi:hypothetical protein